MDCADAAVTTAALSLDDPRPSHCARSRIHFDVYGDMARSASTQSVADMAAAAKNACVVVFIHGGGFAAGDKNQ
jgi:acetyl esterase/lipase